MKKPCLLTTLFIFIFLHFQVFNVSGQDYLGKPPKPIFYQLTQQDKLNYTLSAGTPIKIKRDTFLYKLTPNNFKVKQEKQDCILIPVTLTNNSNDSLKYIGMSCSWWDIYEIDNSQINILQLNEIYYKNGPAIITIAPNTSSVVNLPIGWIKGQTKTTEFRIGMILQKYIDNKQIIDFSKLETNNIIWSNEVTIP